MESHVVSLSKFIKENKENFFLNFIEGYNWTNTDEDALFYGRVLVWLTT